MFPGNIYDSFFFDNTCDFFHQNIIVTKMMEVLLEKDIRFSKPTSRQVVINQNQLVVFLVCCVVSVFVSLCVSLFICIFYRGKLYIQHKVSIAYIASI